MNRRTLLTLLGAGTVSLAGCTSGSGPAGTDEGTPTETPHPDDGVPEATDTTTTGDGTAEPNALPEDCPTTQDLGVEWPTDLDAEAVESFVEAYEHEYHREVVVAYEPETPLDEYGLSGSVSEGPRRAGDGWTLTYSGSGGVYRPGLFLGATPADPPEGANVVSADELEDERLTELFTEAVDTGEAEAHVDRRGAEAINRYLDLFASVSDEFALSGPGDSDTLYVDVDGTTVELDVTADNFHGDYWWGATYYVDERVVRRTEEDTDPREGELLECRPGDS